MKIEIKPFSGKEILSAIAIWNQVVQEGVAFPQEECLTKETGLQFFREQSFVGIAWDLQGESPVGLYILHPNNVGRCGHICNASYAVLKEARGQKIGEALVLHCLAKAKELGFGILQFNAVVASNQVALALYQKLGFRQLGRIPGGFRMKNGELEDIIPHYHLL